MKFFDLNGKEHNITLTPYIKEGSNKSGPHTLTRQLIKQIFGLSPVCEELRIPGSLLRLDFFLPHFKLAIEVNGEQHEEYTPFFHGTKGGFKKALNRDNDKEKWCKINNIKLVKLYDTESESEWAQKLKNY